MLGWIFNKDLYLWKNHGIKGLFRVFALSSIAFVSAAWVSYLFSSFYIIGFETKKYLKNNK